MATGSAPNYSGTGGTMGALAGSLLGPIGMGVGGALGSTIGSMFGGKESSGNNLGARDNEYMDRVYPGTTPYERLTGGAAGQAASAGNAERLSSRALQQQREAMDKQLQMKQKELDTSKSNVAMQTQAQLESAKISAHASMYGSDKAYQGVNETRPHMGKVYTVLEKLIKNPATFLAGIPPKYIEDFKTAWKNIKYMLDKETYDPKRKPMAPESPKPDAVVNTETGEYKRIKK